MNSKIDRGSNRLWEVYRPRITACPDGNWQKHEKEIITGRSIPAIILNRNQHKSPVRSIILLFRDKHLSWCWPQNRRLYSPNRVDTTKTSVLKGRAVDAKTKAVKLDQVLLWRSLKVSSDRTSFDGTKLVEDLFWQLLLPFLSVSQKKHQGMINMSSMS